MRLLSKYLLITIAMAISTVANAGSLIELKTPTLPCEGCYFAVFDKVKKEKNYKLTYITPNIPDMATIVKNKQEVLWVAANGDYSPYWSWTVDPEKFIYKGTNLNFGKCDSQLIGKVDNSSYECTSKFWSNEF